eukprot:9517822-Lingulodinium_polyedra.AAC.1
MHGVSEVLALNGQVMLEASPKLTGGRAGAAAFEKWLREVDVADAADLMKASEAGVELFCAKLLPGHLFLVPPGF